MASRRERLKRKRHQRATAGVISMRIAAVAVAAAVVLVVGTTATAFAVVDKWLQGLPSMNDPAVFAMAQPTRIYAANGKLLANLYLENREVVGLDKMSPSFVHGVIAVEDERFYTHQGWDPQGVLRAVLIDISRGSSSQGASTITQQYVRNTVLAAEKTQRSAQRKVREMYLANELEKRYTKNQILNMYLNTVYFGEGAYGAEAAALTYFGKHNKDLTLGEAAILAGLPQSPSRLSPYENIKGARARQVEVLQRMVKNGYITQAQARHAAAARISLHRGSTAQGIYQAAYFVDYVKRYLQDKYGTGVVYKGGLKVYTTLDLKTQAQAEQSVKAVLNQHGDPDAAVVAIDPQTGYIKAMVGGSNYKKSKFNLATQSKRQPGSAFKAFVLATALDERIPPYRAIDSGSPAVIPETPKDWVVNNSEGTGSGNMPIDQATWHSVNVVFARLIHEMGARRVRDMANAMGIKTHLPKLDSIALGSIGVTPLEMASAYGTLANQGVQNDPIAVTKIVGPDGKVLYIGRPTRKRVLSREVAYAETKILEGVISQGTGTAADIGRPAAGKTGTTTNYRDAWFVGYTPQLVTSVWVGYAATEQPMTDIHGIKVYGGTFPAEIWKTFMDSALADLPSADFKSAPDPKYTWNDNWVRWTPPPPTPSPSKTNGNGGNNGNSGGGRAGGSGGQGRTGGSGGSGGGTTTTSTP
jgi:1A family penicillin-binding protein